MKKYILILVLFVGVFGLVKFSYADYQQLTHDTNTDPFSAFPAQSLGTGLTGSFDTIDVFGGGSLSLTICHADTLNAFYANINNAECSQTGTTIDATSSNPAINNLTSLTLSQTINFEPSKWYVIQTNGTSLILAGSADDNSYLNGVGQYDSTFGLFYKIPNQPDYFRYVNGSLKDIYFRIYLSLPPAPSGTLAIDFPQNQATSTDFQSFYLSYNINNWGDYTGYLAGICYGISQTQVGACDPTTRRVDSILFPNTPLINMDTKFKTDDYNLATSTPLIGGMWILKNQTLPTGTYYEKAILYGITPDHYEHLLAVSPEALFTIFQGNYLNNYTAYQYSSSSLNLGNIPSSTSVFNVSSTPFDVDCSVDTTFGCYFKKGFMYIIGILFKPNTTMTNYLNDSFIAIQNVFPFQLFYGLNSAVQVAIHQPNASSTLTTTIWGQTITILTPTLFEDIFGIDAKNLIFNVITAIGWVGAGILVYLVVV